MTIIGPGLTLVGDPTFNSSVLAVALHSATPPACDGLNVTANALGFPVLYVHTRGFSHPEMTVFNSLRTLSSNFLAGFYEPWIEVSLERQTICYASIGLISWSPDANRAVQPPPARVTDPQ